VQASVVCTAATAPSALDVTGGDSAVEISVAGSQLGDGGDKGPVVCFQAEVSISEVSFPSVVFVYLFNYCSYSLEPVGWLV